MHKSLQPTTNLLLIAVTASVVLTAMLLSSPTKVLPVIVAGAILGTVQGCLQRRAISAAKETLLAAGTALEVRQALMTSKVGRASIYGLWISAFLLVILTAMMKQTPPMGIVAGYASLMFFRDLIALKGCYQLQRRWEGKKQEVAP